MKTYRIVRYLTNHELEQLNEARRRRAVLLFSLFTVACVAGVAYVVTR